VSYIDDFGTSESLTSAPSDEIERYLPPFEPPFLPETTETLFASGYIFGTTANETIIPTSGNVQVHGGDGDDVFQLDTDYTRAFGGSGNDVFFLQGQNQHATGGSGNDTFVIGGPLLGSVIHDFNAEEDTLYFANAVGNLVHFDDLADAASQVNGDVLINTAVGQVKLAATDLKDLNQNNIKFYRDEVERPDALVIPETGGAITAPGWITGTDANDLVISGGGNIRVSGGFGDDHLIAEHWGVRILGGSGSDLLEARDLNALFYGGSGTDQFYFTDRVDGLIGDFQSGLDQVVLNEGLGFENSEGAFAALTDTDDGAVLLSSNGDQLLFANLEVSQLDQNDFIFI
jgi:Ca2+-binding RTX toxin-like protein